MCIKLEIINKLYYDARPTKYQDLIRLLGLSLIIRPPQCMELHYVIGKLTVLH